MIRPCSAEESESIAAVVNDAAQAYRGVVPERLLGEPYMSLEELGEELRTVTFYGHEERGHLLGVMGIEPVGDVTLLRHAYVRTAHQRRGIGARLLRHIEATARRGWLLLGTWAASWAVGFYEKHGYEPMPDKDRLLARYWPRVGADQAANSVVLGKQLSARNCATPRPK